MTSYLQFEICVALVLMFVAGGCFTALFYERRADRNRKALARWRIRLGQLHEAHMTARDAWTRQGNAKHAHRHADTVNAAKALMQHIEGMPL